MRKPSHPTPGDLHTHHMKKHLLTCKEHYHKAAPADERSRRLGAVYIRSAAPGHEHSGSARATHEPTPQCTRGRVQQRAADESVLRHFLWGPAVVGLECSDML